MSTTTTPRRPHPVDTIRIRPAGVGDAETVHALVLELATYENSAPAVQATVDDHVDDPPPITWGVREDNGPGLRFYLRIGARMRPKVVAAWTPDVYIDYLDSR